MSSLYRYLSLFGLLYLSSCCEGPEFASFDHIFLKNNSNETVIGLFSFYECDGYDPLTKYAFKCKPNERIEFPFTKHNRRRIAVKIYQDGDVDFKKIDYLPAEPLARYLLSLDQLRKHDWTFTYPPSEEWMQSGIKEIESNN